jgi:hypothetical protein
MRAVIDKRSPAVGERSLLDRERSRPPASGRVRGRKRVVRAKMRSRSRTAITPQSPTAAASPGVLASRWRPLASINRRGDARTDEVAAFERVDDRVGPIGDADAALAVRVSDR